MCYRTLNVLLLFWMGTSSVIAQNSGENPFKVGIVGLTHDHVHWILNRAKDPDIEIVGIVEKDQKRADLLLQQYELSSDLLFPTIEDMLASAQPEAVTAFNPISEHLEIVKKCAPQGVHVMVEKPLAVSLSHAKKMEKLANEHNIHLLTNYETTWYGSNHEAKQMVEENKIGDLRKIVVRDGHKGPREIGCSEPFLKWLTNPEKNGAGALTDFGCYGANLVTWLQKGQRPTAVFAVTQQVKPEIYPEVDDEATIVLIYPKTQAIIQASWNWPFSRKDISIYGKTGSINNLDGINMSIKLSEEEGPYNYRAKELEAPVNDPFTYLAAIVRNDIKMDPFDLSSLENNMIVMEILEAAMKSAKTGKKVKIKSR